MSGTIWKATGNLTKGLAVISTTAMQSQLPPDEAGGSIAIEGGAAVYTRALEIGQVVQEFNVLFEPIGHDNTEDVQCELN
jgi:hypothetical protein